MSILYLILFSLAVAILTIVAMQAAVRVVGLYRARDYLTHEKQSREALAARFPIPAVTSSSTVDYLKSLSDLVSPMHQEAIDAQTVYHSAVVRSATCLALAFCAQALAATCAHLVFYWLDAIAIGLLLINFWRGRAANVQWIKRRAAAELLRQYAFLAPLFPLMRATGRAHDLTSQFEAESSRLKERVLDDASGRDIISRIDDFWSSRRSSIEGHVPTEADLSADALLLYLQKRPLHQLGWFADSKMRLERKAHRLKQWLLVFYWTAFSLAVIKLIVVLPGEHEQIVQSVQSVPIFSATIVSILSEALSPALLVVTGLSAAMTASYLSQNARSLIHRYNTQERRIAQWFEMFQSRCAIEDLRKPMHFKTERKIEIRNLVLQFEGLMIEELTDWVHISRHDAIELAP
ncbi:MAG: hypothetical protein L0387_35180 [Acidobacteria bacterium]|nr:hypothetical protein [Acidobacteriota bacterium]